MFFYMEREKIPKLSPRLEALCAMIRPGARLLDVGSDHAYLPVRAVLDGRAEKALATDIAAGPVARAKRHIEEYAVSDRVGVLRTPGLENTAFFGATDIVIAGMGGELIASIMEDCDYLRDAGVRLILQPMTKGAALRAYLAGKGFAIDGEAQIEEDERIYEALFAHWTGVPYTLTRAECEIGPILLRQGGETLRRRLARKCALLEKAIAGMKRGSLDCRDEEELLRDLRAAMKQ